MTTKTPREKIDVINEASKESFPTSDPPAWTLGTEQSIRSYRKGKLNEIYKQLYQDHLILRKAIAHLHLLINPKHPPKEQGLFSLTKMIEFFVLFADHLHAHKEEMLYPLLVTFKKGPSDYMIHNLREEHRYGHKLLNNLKQIHKNNKNQQEIFTQLNAILNFYKIHLSKEEEYVFPYLQNELTAEMEHNLLNQFDALQERIKKKEYQELLKIAEELSAT